MLLYNLPLFLSLSAVAVLPLGLIMFFAMRGLVEALAESGFLPGQDFDAEEWLQQQSKELLLACLLIMIVSIIFGITTEAAIIRAVAELYAGDSHPKFTRCLGEGIRKLGSILCYRVSLSLILFVMIMCLLLVCYIFIWINGFLGGLLFFLGYMFVLIYVGIAMIAAIPTIVVENKRWCLDAMRRSWELTSQKRCFLFCVMLLFLLVIIILNLVMIGFLSIFVGAEDLAGGKGAVAYMFLHWFLVPYGVM